MPPPHRPAHSKSRACETTLQCTAALTQSSVVGEQHRVRNYSQMEGLEALMEQYADENGCISRESMRQALEANLGSVSDTDVDRVSSAASLQLPPHPTLRFCDCCRCSHLQSVYTNLTKSCCQLPLTAPPSSALSALQSQPELLSPDCVDSFRCELC